jgi:PepSY-associated TM region
MRTLILLHRWLGVAFCLLFAMWFASGIVMHFVPFPALPESDRIAGLAPIDIASAGPGPAEAMGASGLSDVSRVTLLQRSDGPVYLIADSERVVALHAADLSEATVRSQRLALAIATDYAGHRQWDAAAARVAALRAYDQWTVAGNFDRHRPLYRIALGDARGTELYVSSTTGEVVLETAWRQRAWNYVGSVAHWFYPTALRRHATVWNAVVWELSLAALIGASAGAVIGTLRFGSAGSRLGSPYRGWQALHHWLGLCCMLFVLTWIFSGWLSMDDGLLFSTGKPAAAEVAAVAGAPDWSALPADELRHIGPQTVETEWFAFNGEIYRRERTGLDVQTLAVADSHSGGASPAREFLTGIEVDALAARLGRKCDPAFIADSDDAYALTSVVPGAPVFRLICGSDWFHIDASSGILIEKLDASRRLYRWLFAGLHTFDFHVLMVRPALRTTLIVALCGLGFVFSLTGIVIAWRRLLACFRSPLQR